MSFKELKLNPQILRAIAEKGYTQATPIQVKAIPLILNGQDVIGIAQTGTGKTAAFVLPLLMKLKYAQGTNPRALILSPSKELALQIYENVKMYSKNLDLRSICLYGGVGPKTQIEQLDAGMDLIVATPGRLWEIYQKGKLVTKEIKTVVLDEADKLMDMGFMPQLERIQEVLPVKRQNLLFSATFPPKVELLSEDFLEFPQRVEVNPQATVVDTISQYYYKTPNFMSKIHLLGHLLSSTDELKKVMVFANTKKVADDISKFIDRKLEGGVRVIHSNKSQNARINSIQEFSEGRVRTLVTTDVSARGIDVKDVTHVINFQVPYIYDDYIHRIGRTGRALKKGVAISFANKGEELHIEKIEYLIRQKVKEALIPVEVKIPETPKEEAIEIDRMVDGFKRKEDPDFKGAFHEKKKRIPKDKKLTGRRSNKKRR